MFSKFIGIKYKKFLPAGQACRLFRVFGALSPAGPLHKRRAAQGEKGEGEARIFLLFASSMSSRNEKKAQRSQPLLWLPWTVALLVCVVLYLNREWSICRRQVDAGMQTSQQPQPFFPHGVLLERAPDGAGCTSFICQARANLTVFTSSLVQNITEFKPFNQREWDKFNPVISCPPTRPLVKYGSGDGSKLLCELGTSLNRADGSTCVIYSLGSNGDYQFEEEMLAATPCDVHTFDCTYDGASINPKRHYYHDWCIGRHGGRYRSWANITATLGHKEVDLLKMDIEGHEFNVLAALLPTDNLPREMSIEMHLGPFGTVKPKSSAELALLFLHLANLGYATYSKEVNVLAPYCCSEFSFMRVNHG